MGFDLWGYVFGQLDSTVATFKNIKQSNERKSFAELREIRDQLTAETPRIAYIRDYLTQIEQNLEKYRPIINTVELRNKFEEEMSELVSARKYLLDIELTKSTFYEITRKGIVEFQIDLATSVSIKTYSRKLDVIYKKINKKNNQICETVENENNAKLLAMFHSIDAKAMDKIDAIEEMTVSKLENIFSQAKNSSQINKIFREAKHIINEAIETAFEVNQSAMSKVQRALPRKKLRIFNVLKVKNTTMKQMENEVMMEKVQFLFRRKQKTLCSEIKYNRCNLRRKELKWASVMSPQRGRQKGKCAPSGSKHIRQTVHSNLNLRNNNYCAYQHQQLKQQPQANLSKHTRIREDLCGVNERSVIGRNTQYLIDDKQNWVSASEYD